ncbi:unnamed protein product, partial [Rotaria sp. Silwood2]
MFGPIISANKTGIKNSDSATSDLRAFTNI